MKNHTPFLVMFAAFAVGDYLALSCVNWSWNPGTWPIGWRVGMVLFPLALLFAGAVAAVQETAKP